MYVRMDLFIPTKWRPKSDRWMLTWHAINYSNTIVILSRKNSFVQDGVQMNALVRLWATPSFK